MSETKKWITSISGAVVGQIVVLAFFYILVTNTTTPSLSANASSFEQREVTVMLSQLMEQAIEELPEPEIKPAELIDEPEEEPLPEEIPMEKEKSFIDTDSNIKQMEAPQNARFESDRNTFASTEFLPDPNLPQEVGPTLRGEEKIENLSLANQEYADGEIMPDATPPPAMSEAGMPAEQSVEAPPVEETKDTAPSEMNEKTESESPADQISEGDAEEAKPSDADTPPDRISELLTQPDTEKIAEKAQEEMTTQSFIDPGNSSNLMRVPALTGEMEQEAFATQIAEEKGEPGAPEEKQEIKATPVESGKSVDEIKQQQPTAAEMAIQKQLDESMFNPAFLAHRRKNNQNGDITNIGEGSVDAESTEAGIYKKAVRQAIEKKWHQYRLDRGADVTWGVLRLRFIVTPSGRVKNLEIKKKEATELVTEFSLKAIVDAKIPPMPADVAEIFGPGGMEMHYNIVIY